MGREQPDILIVKFFTEIACRMVRHICIIEVMKILNSTVFEMQAAMCQVLSNPKRLMIIDMLGIREMSVGEIAETLGVAPATASQHLRLLKDSHLVSSRKEAQTVYYKLAVPRMMDACLVVRSIIIESMQQRGELAEDLTPDNLIQD